MLNPAKLTAGELVRMATRIIESEAIEPTQLRDSMIQTLAKHVVDFKKQTELAASTDF